MGKTKVCYRTTAKYDVLRTVKEADFSCKVPVYKKVHDDRVHATLDDKEFTYEHPMPLKIIGERIWDPTQISYGIVRDLLRKRFGDYYRHELTEITKNIFTLDTEAGRQGVLDLKGKMTLYYPYEKPGGDRSFFYQAKKASKK